MNKSVNDSDVVEHVTKRGSALGASFFLRLFQAAAICFLFTKSGRNVII